MAASLRKKGFALLFVLCALLPLSSCEGEFVYVDDLVGSWQLIEVNGIPVYDYGYEPDYYLFRPDGTGVYSYYDRFGRLREEDFYWDKRQYSGVMYLSFVNGSIGDWSCYYRFDDSGNCLFLSYEPDFYTYSTYLRTSR